MLLAALPFSREGGDCCDPRSGASVLQHGALFGRGVVRFSFWGASVELPSPFRLSGWSRHWGRAMALGGPFVLVVGCAPLARVFFDFGCFGAWGRAASPQIVPTSPKCWAKNSPHVVWKEVPPLSPHCRGAAWMGPNAVPPGRLARASRPTGAPRVCGGDVPRAPELWAGGARVVLSSHPPLAPFDGANDNGPSLWGRLQLSYSNSRTPLVGWSMHFPSSQL